MDIRSIPPTKVRSMRVADPYGYDLPLTECRKSRGGRGVQARRRDPPGAAPGEDPPPKGSCRVNLRGVSRATTGCTRAFSSKQATGDLNMCSECQSYDRTCAPSDNLTGSCLHSLTKLLFATSCARSRCLGLAPADSGAMAANGFNVGDGARLVLGDHRRPRGRYRLTVPSQCTLQSIISCSPRRFVLSRSVLRAIQSALILMRRVA